MYFNKNSEKAMWHISIKPLILDHLICFALKNHLHHCLKCYFDKLLIRTFEYLNHLGGDEDSHYAPYLCHLKLLKVYCNLALENNRA